MGSNTVFMRLFDLDKWQEAVGSRQQFCQGQELLKQEILNFIEYRRQVIVGSRQQSCQD